VLVWRFDRFARSSAHLVEALEEFRALGVRFVSHQEAIDTSTPMGAAMFTIIAAMAQPTRDIISERGKMDLANARPGQACRSPALRLRRRRTGADTDVTRGRSELREDQRTSRNAPVERCAPRATRQGFAWLGRATQLAGDGL
jgi:DNA invertase Pin-like site-specific DNA recombinase